MKLSDKDMENIFGWSKAQVQRVVKDVPNHDPQQMYVHLGTVISMLLAASCQSMIKLGLHGECMESWQKIVVDTTALLMEEDLKGKALTTVAPFMKVSEGVSK